VKETIKGSGPLSRERVVPAEHRDEWKDKKQQWIEMTNRPCTHLVKIRIRSRKVLILRMQDTRLQVERSWESGGQSTELVAVREEVLRVKRDRRRRKLVVRAVGVQTVICLHTNRGVTAPARTINDLRRRLSVSLFAHTTFVDGRVVFSRVREQQTIIDECRL
jgi:hypothetical protein